MDVKQTKQSNFIYWASGIVSICGIVFEVLFGAIGSYILGDGVKQYTLTISLFLTGMGIGASLSEKVTGNLVLSFIYIEYLVALIGGFSSLTMFTLTAFGANGIDALFLYTITLVIGALTGVELPILIRKANEIGVTLERSTARVLFSDYAGGLIGGLLFVFFLRPQLGMIQSAFFVGCINLIVALVILFLFRKEIKRVMLHTVIGTVIAILLLLGLLFGQPLTSKLEQKMYSDPIIYMEESTYQKIVLTRQGEDIRFYLDGGLQFSSIDEHRYHEVLVHPVMSITEKSNILVLGGGDGLAVREILKYDDVEHITVVDLDPAVVDLAIGHPFLKELNKQAFQHEKVTVVHDDAFEFLKSGSDLYDVIIVDLPDPNNESINKLYTKEFYSLVRNHLQPWGAAMIQATSPVFAVEVYWTIHHTIESTGLFTIPLHVDVPSFGNWGFVLASRKEVEVAELFIEEKVQTKYITNDLIESLTTFGKDEDANIVDRNGEKKELEINTLINPILLPIYEDSWKYY
ncbi:spermidine synthase [Gracilibacillus halotolerans]|uniref:Polyamine aminopropyltransferase n=1 Tax=Gracilibacillus halotolerans TaxID=74386 RepID=A0A841RN53_9BACI|nr:polyamine aminopropyltransferase [Gracilibacillus halotolerans]MBB6513919.1 spermidine synthase [Gracilibacillus halotolerans]